MKKLNSAIVGLGRIGSLFSSDKLRKGIVTHAAAYVDNPDTELIAACDIDDVRLKEFGNTWDIKNRYTDLDDMLKNERIDILSVCTWDKTHHDIVIKAAKAGVKAIFCEKPISDNLEKADEMVKVCRDNGVYLAVNHSRRWDVFEQKIRSYIGEGKLGKVQNISAYYTAGISNTGTHLIDLLRMLFGEAKWVWSNPETGIGEIDPTLDGCIYFEDKVSCFLHGLDAKEYIMFEIDIYGTKGRIRIKNSGFDIKMWEVADSPRFSGYKELKEIEPFVKDGYKDVLKNAVSDMVSCIKENREAVSSGIDGTKTLEIICALQKSLKDGGEKVNLPFKERNITIKKK